MQRRVMNILFVAYRNAETVHVHFFISKLQVFYIFKVTMRNHEGAVVKLHTGALKHYRLAVMGKPQF